MRPPLVVVFVYGLFLFLVLVSALLLLGGIVSAVFLVAHSGTGLPDMTGNHI